MSDTATAAPEDAPQGAETEQQTETPSVEDLLKEVETWKGHARKHEDRAKANADAKKELDRIRREAMTEDERRKAEDDERTNALAEAVKRASEAEAALARSEVVIEFGLSKEDAEALAGVTDPASLRVLAERLSGRSSSEGLRPNPSQGRQKTGPLSPRDAGIAALGGLFG